MVLHRSKPENVNENENTKTTKYGQYNTRCQLINCQKWVNAAIFEVCFASLLRKKHEIVDRTIENQQPN